MSEGQRPGSVTVADTATRAAVLRRLELEIGRRLDGSAAGDHLTSAIGPGSERAGARDYVAGDDARLIDWNLTARSPSTQVRTTEAEREVDTWVIADRSASLDFGTAQTEKRDVVLGAAAAFGMLSVRGHNRFGVVVSGTERPQEYPPRTGRSWLMVALSGLYDTPRQSAEPPEDRDVASALQRLLSTQRRRSQVVVVSDFLGSDRWVKPLRSVALRHQVVAVHVTDPRELALPAVGILAVVDTETGRQRYVDTTPSMRARYATAAAQRQEQIARSVASAGAEYLHLSTASDWLTDTWLFAVGRKSRRLLGPVGGRARPPVESHPQPHTGATR